MVARMSGDGVPVMAWIFSIWSISLVPGNSGNRLTTCVRQQVKSRQLHARCLLKQLNQESAAVLPSNFVSVSAFAACQVVCVKCCSMVVMAAGSLLESPFCFCLPVVSVRVCQLGS